MNEQVALYKTRSKKVIIIAITLVLLITTLLSASGCAMTKTKEPIKFASNYSEEIFRNEIAKVKSDNVSLASNGVSDYVIVYPDVLDEPIASLQDKEKRSKLESDRISLLNAVNFLQSSLTKIVGSNFAKVKASSYTTGNKIVLSVDADNTTLVDGGYALNINDGSIDIIGAEYVGVTNGIYSFLEKNLGCMFVSTDYDYLPNLPTINLEKASNYHNPDVKWRSVYANESEKNGEIVKDDIQWYNKLKLNGAGREGWGTWVHTFYSFISPDEYFENHPEYFSEYNGKRKYEDGPVSGQLCLTNEDVYDIISTKLFQKMAENPSDKYWDVSQMDTWINRGTGCRCTECKKLDDAEDSPMGSLLTFINRLADECAEKFPDNFISTLAYNYSAKPPKNMKPRDNVIIKLCFMPGDVTSDIKDPRNSKAEASNELITKWGEISKHLLIWDYNVDFKQYLMPYPIYGALQVNNDFYIDNNVYGIFHQFDRDKGGYSAELSAYVLSQIMWDRTVKVDDIVSKYLTVYYGAAAEPIIEYYNSMEANVYKANRPLYIYSTVAANRFDYLSAKNVKNYLELFEEAEQLAVGDDVLIGRIKQLKIGVLYVKAKEPSLDLKGRLAALEEFKELCDLHGIQSVYEGNPNKDNEVLTFYENEKKLISAVPYITAGSIAAGIMLIGGIAVVIILVKKRKPNGKVSINN